jgi:hypothetical protein
VGASPAARARAFRVAVLAVAVEGHIFSAAYDLARFENRPRLRRDFRRSLLELAFDASASNA